MTVTVSVTPTIWIGCETLRTSSHIARDARPTTQQQQDISGFNRSCCRSVSKKKSTKRIRSQQCSHRKNCVLIPHIRYILWCICFRLAFSRPCRSSFGKRWLIFLVSRWESFHPCSGLPAATGTWSDTKNISTTQGLTRDLLVDREVSRVLLPFSMRRWLVMNKLS